VAAQPRRLRSLRAAAVSIALDDWDDRVLVAGPASLGAALLRPRPGNPSSRSWQIGSQSGVEIAETDFLLTRATPSAREGILLTAP